MNFIKSPILIVGAARSGTSIVAGIVNLCGAWGGNFVQASSNNPKGFFENRMIREGMVKPFLRSMVADPMGQKIFPEIDKIREAPGFASWRGAVEEVIRKQGYPWGPWFYKCPKSIHLWSLWHEAFPEAMWILVRRRDEEIIASCLRTSFMRAYRDIAGWQGWLDIHKQRFAELKAAAYPNVMEVWPELAIRGELAQMEAMVEWLGLRWDDAKVKEFVNPELWRQK